MKRGLRITLWIVGILVALTLLPILFIYSGLYNVAATYPETDLMRWVLNTTKDYSVKRHAAGITAPDGLGDPAMVTAGAGFYRGHCLGCHGAPGVERGEFALGMNPRPPLLERLAARKPANELFWATKYGIRMTGMPAWGVAESDEELWQATAFMRQMPTMTPEQYRAMEREAPAEEEEE
jgi:mono/diheme cytochrome c family protein